jgi:hypothetical protein
LGFATTSEEFRLLHRILLGSLVLISCLANLSADDRPLLSISPATASPGQTITVTLTVPATIAHLASATDWIGLFAVGAPNTARDPARWGYTGGAASASPTITAPSTPGNYEVRYFIRDSFECVATSNTLVVRAAPTLATSSSKPVIVISPSTVAAGQAITVNLTLSADIAPLAASNDWIGLFAVGAANTARDPARWGYTGGAASASPIITAPSTAGFYEVRYFARDGFERIATSNTISVLPSPSAVTTAPIAVTVRVVPSLTVSPASLTAGGSITVSWSGATGAAVNDWLALLPVGAPSTSYDSGRAMLTNGAASGSVACPAPAAGTYEVRYHVRGTFEVLAVSTPIVVTAPAPVAVVQPTPTTMPVAFNGVLISDIEAASPGADQTLISFVEFLHLMGLRTFIDDDNGTESWYMPSDESHNGWTRLRVTEAIDDPLLPWSEAYKRLNTRDAKGRLPFGWDWTQITTNVAASTIGINPAFDIPITIGGQPYLRVGIDWDTYYATYASNFPEVRQYMDQIPASRHGGWTQRFGYVFPNDVGRKIDEILQLIAKRNDDSMRVFSLVVGVMLIPVTAGISAGLGFAEVGAVGVIEAGAIAAGEAGVIAAAEASAITVAEASAIAAAEASAIAAAEASSIIAAEASSIIAAETSAIAAAEASAIAATEATAVVATDVTVGTVSGSVAVDQAVVRAGVALGTSGGDPNAAFTSLVGSGIGNFVNGLGPIFDESILDSAAKGLLTQAGTSILTTGELPSLESFAQSTASGLLTGQNSGETTETSDLTATNQEADVTVTENVNDTSPSVDSISDEPAPVGVDPSSDHANTFWDETVTLEPEATATVGEQNELNAPGPETTEEIGANGNEGDASTPVTANGSESENPPVGTSTDEQTEQADPGELAQETPSTESGTETAPVPQDTVPNPDARNETDRERRLRLSNLNAELADEFTALVVERGIEVMINEEPLGERTGDAIAATVFVAVLTNQVGSAALVQATFEGRQVVALTMSLHQVHDAIMQAGGMVDENGLMADMTIQKYDGRMFAMPSDAVIFTRADVYGNNPFKTSGDEFIIILPDWAVADILGDTPRSSLPVFSNRQLPNDTVCAAVGYPGYSNGATWFNQLPMNPVLYPLVSKVSVLTSNPQQIDAWLDLSANPSSPNFPVWWGVSGGPLLCMLDGQLTYVGTMSGFAEQMEPTIPYQHLEFVRPSLLAEPSAAPTETTSEPSSPPDAVGQNLIAPESAITVDGTEAAFNQFGIDPRSSQPVEVVPPAPANGAAYDVIGAASVSAVDASAAALPDEDCPVPLIADNETANESSVTAGGTYLVLPETRIDALVLGNFESPSVATTNSSDSYQYNPAGSDWTFSGGAGITASGSAFTDGSPQAPSGPQVAFIQSFGSMSRATDVTAGLYSVSFQSTQRVNWQERWQVLLVYVDGQVVGAVFPESGVFTTYTTGAFSLLSGSHTVTISGLNPFGGDNTAFVDAVQLVVAATTPGSNG